MKRLTRNDKLGFGQYREYTVAEVMDADPQYLVWALHKEVFTVSTNLYNDIRWAEQEECSDGEYYIGCPEQD